MRVYYDRIFMNYFWAKTTLDGKPGISVYEHMINVGYVARHIVEIFPELLDRFQIPSSSAGALAALHDLGKISPGFQRKCFNWLQENNLEKIDRNGCWDTKMERDHGKISHAAVQSFLTNTGIDRKTAKYVSTLLGAHHGRLNMPNDSGYRPPGKISESVSKIDWEKERMECAERVWNQFGGNNSFVLLDDSPAIWWLAGLTSVSDWIGSDERFFPSDRKGGDVDVSLLAKNAIEAIGIGKMEFRHNLSFHDLFHLSDRPDTIWMPNDMQEKVFTFIKEPGVYIIEAPMGMGKTEAALWAAYHLLVSGKANGIYFALPTQATSNRMHLRMNKFVRRISHCSNKSRLIHANSWLFDKTAVLQPSTTNNGSTSDDARTGRDWFSSAKRALISPFGVGTIDQALLGVVAAKHFFVRHFALAGKVVILDEIHSYDLYTGTLIDKLITTLESLGCTVVILSATLTGERRGQIISCPEGNLKDENFPYPLITGRMDGHLLRPMTATPPDSKTIEIEFVEEGNAAAQAIKVAQKGGTVLWVCNTVDTAQKQYQKIKEFKKEDFLVGLLHSRFPFWKRESLEEEWMERFGKKGESRCGSILVSTQIVEQSVDLDADLLITELAPTDMILQRLGRLWRHKRGSRPVDEPRMCIIEETKSLEDFKNMEPKDITDTLGGKSMVYAPFVLLRSLEVWTKAQPHVTIPRQIRELIEETYIEREREPDSWMNLFYEWRGIDSAKKMEASRNSNLWQLALDDKEGGQTRLNEMPTLPLVLCEKLTKEEIIFIDGSKGQTESASYSLTTAQAIHKNLVKVPEYCFVDRIKPYSAFENYLFGKQCVGIVMEDGSVQIKGLKEGIKLYYFTDLGLVIKKST